MLTTDDNLAICLIEFSSIATGIKAGDALVKDAPVTRLYAGTVQPGRYILLGTGDVASVQIGYERAVGMAPSEIFDDLLLPNVHRDVIAALLGKGPAVAAGDALGILETKGVAAAIRGADAGRKAADIALCALALADDLNGKGIALFSGDQPEVIAAMDAAAEAAGDSSDPATSRTVVEIIPRLHEDMQLNLGADLRFRKQLF